MYKNFFNRLVVTCDDTVSTSETVPIYSIDKTDYCFIGTIILVIICSLLLISIAINCFSL